MFRHVAAKNGRTINDSFKQNVNLIENFKWKCRQVQRRDENSFLQ